MNDIMETPSRSELTNTGVQAAGYLAGGILYLGMGALPGIVGIAAGGIATVAGVVSLLGKSKEDNKAGAVVAGGGVFKLLERFGVLPIVKATGGFLLSLGGVALLGLGVYKGFKFLRGLRKMKS